MFAIVCAALLQQAHAFYLNTSLCLLATELLAMEYVLREHGEPCPTRSLGGRTNRVLQVHGAQRALEEQTALQRSIVAVPDAHLVVGVHRRHGVVARQLPALRRNTSGV